MRRITRIARIALVPALLGTLLALGGRAAASPAAATPSLASSVVANANWIMNEVMPDGAIEIYPDSPPTSIEPYFANYAAMGLARAGLLTGNQRYTNAAWNWLTWYANHEGAHGFVTDYTFKAGVETSTGTEDSTDSYAGTFLSAVAMAYPTNPSRLAGLAVGIQGAIGAILATQDRDGMTWATPSYPVKYLMDNGEAYDGLEAAARMEHALGNTAWATVATTAANAMYNGIQTLWNPSAGDYNWAKFGNGSQQSTNWAVLYPDALEEASAAIFHVAGNRTSALVAAFNAHQPSWAQPAVVSYQPQPAMAQEAVGGANQGEQGAATIDQYAVANGRAWPFNVAVAGELIFAESDSALVGA